MSFQPQAIAERFGIRNLGALTGLITMVHHVCGGIGAYVGARVFDASGRIVASAQRENRLVLLSRQRSSAELAGMNRYRELAAELGLVPAARPLAVGAA